MPFDNAVDPFRAMDAAQERANARKAKRREFWSKVGALVERGAIAVLEAFAFTNSAYPSFKREEARKNDRQDVRAS